MTSHLPGPAKLVLCSLIAASLVSVCRADSPRAGDWRIRAELSGGNTFTTDGVWRNDAYAVHALELEWMLFGHVSMGLRALPVLAYFDPAPIFGSGFGLTNRVYWTRDGAGPYLGLGSSLVAHYPRFERNSSNINILSSFELGYQFQRSRYRIGAKLEHVSNANVARRNLGWNGVSLLFGAAF